LWLPGSQHVGLPAKNRFMKILLVHPTDSAADGPWAEDKWSLAVDLGWSGRNFYERQTERLGYRVVSIYDLLEHQQHRRRMREILDAGLGQLVDSESVDWWEVFSVQPYQRLEQIMLLSVLAEQIPDHAELVATRPHSALPALTLLLNREIRSFSAESRTNRQGSLGRYLKAASILRLPQLAEIALDKWDTDYRLRRHVSRAPTKSSEPAFLLPSSYVNVSRAQAAYAQMLPHRRFLLVVTRRNGRLQKLPGNVEVRSLASYASRPSRALAREQADLLATWRKMQSGPFTTNPVVGVANNLHALDGFPSFLQRGLGIREAWRQVFARETIAGVLSGDEYNPFTRLPILLARSRKLRTVFCDHGALNMSFGIRGTCSDTYLARGDMARDYLVEWCGLSPDKVVVGGPRDCSDLAPTSGGERDWIVFYSEAYELSLGRTEVLYEEVLPELCSLARQTNRRVVVKLHPFESHRMRKALVDNVLSGEQRSLVDLREGPMTADLFERAWFSVTVESSVAVECAAKEVPCFLLSWFDASWYDYGKQYAKFSAACPLASPEAIRGIPQLLEQFHVTETTRRGLQTSISPEDLESVLAGRRPS